MIIDSQLSKKAIVRISIAMIFRSISTFILLAFSFILLLFCLFFTFYFGDPIFLIIWSSFIVFMFAVYWISIYRGANAKENAKMYSPVHYEFTENAVETTSPISKGQINWSAFVKWRFLAGHYLIFVNKINFIGIKAEDVPDRKEFEKMLKEKVKKP